MSELESWQTSRDPHEDGLAETVRYLKQCGVESVKPETSCHEGSEVRGATIRDIGSEAKEEEKVGPDI